VILRALEGGMKRATLLTWVTSVQDRFRTRVQVPIFHRLELIPLSQGSPFQIRKVIGVSRSFLVVDSSMLQELWLDVMLMSKAVC
jgi:hypothetical protein